MTAQRGFQSAPQRGAVNCSNRWFAESVQLRKHFPQRRALRWFAEFTDIGAGDECPAGAVNNQRLDRIVAIRFGETVADPFAHGVRQGIDRWVVDGDDRDLAMAGQSDCFAHPALSLGDGERLL